MAGFNTSRSNIKNRTLEIQKTDNYENYFVPSPNAASHTTWFTFPSNINPLSIHIIDKLGRIVKFITPQEPNIRSVKIDTENNQ